MSWGDWLMIFIPGAITGVCITLTVLRPWRPKVTIKAKSER